MLKKVTKFSTGMKKKVGLIQALLANPEILLLDEPTANLDPTSRYEIILTLKKLVKQKEMTILISSHVLTELETIIDHVIMINKGSVIINQPLDIVLNQFQSSRFRTSHSLSAFVRIFSRKPRVDIFAYHGIFTPNLCRPFSALRRFFDS